MASSGFPRRFGSYVLLKPLARGGMGELDLAVTGGHGMEKLCVIKRVLPHLLVADNVQRFREEAAMMMRLSHGNLVGVLDAGREDGQFYLAMDFVEGKDLLATWNRCATQRVAFPVEIAAYIIKELARGLGYAHTYRDLRLVHRDISPANVLLSYSGEVKLTDFGLAISKLKEQRTAPGIIYGKLAYLAPEQARGQPLDGRTDLYAAGILLWEMLTGQQLFPSRLPDAPPPPEGQDGQGDELAGTEGAAKQQARSSTLDALERLRNPTIPAPASITARVPHELNAIVLRALAVDPADRYQTGEELRADLGSFLAKHAPATDAATLAAFMALLFKEQIENEREDRDFLLDEASALLSGPQNRAATGPYAHAAAALQPGSASGGPGAAQLGPPAQPLPVTLGLVDPALWSSSPGVQGGRQNVSAGADSSPSRFLPDGDSRSDSTSEVLPAQGRRQLRDRRGWLRRGSEAGGIADLPYRVYGGHAPPPASEQTAGTGLAPMSNRPPSSPPPGTPSEQPIDEDQRVGSTIAGRYYVRRLCGEGAMGRVYEGHHVEIGRRVAIKILHSNFRNTPDVVERFRREARSASRIGHPNIVDVTDAGTTPDGAFFFVMEYLDGVDLEQLIARGGPVAVERALLIAAQVCRALVAAHAAGIIHRDLKPANVMLVRQRDEEDFVKVLDFGISKQAQLDMDPRGNDVSLTRPDAAVGTPIYMAPEQVAGHAADGRTDVYAVGELLFEMLTAAPPCSGGDIMAVFNKKANEDPPPVRTLRPDAPDAVEQLLIRAMARLPTDRHASMTELKDEIMRCIANLGAAPIGAAPRVTQLVRSLGSSAAGSRTAKVWRPTSRPVWITALGVVAGVGVASIAVLWRTDVATPPRGTTPVPAELATAGRSPAPRQQPSPQGRIALPSSSSARPSVRVEATPIAPGGPPRRANVVTPSRSSGIPRGPLAAASGRGGSTSPRLAPERASGRAAAAPPKRSAPGARTGASGSAGTFGNFGTKSGVSPAAPVGGPPTGSAGAIAPADPLQRGRAAFAKGNFPEAVRLGRAAITAGDGAGGHLLLGDAFYKMERFAEAVGEYDAVLKAAPGNERARRGRELALRRASN